MYTNPQFLLVGQSRRGRVRSEYEDLDEEMFNSWPSKHNDAPGDQLCREFFMVIMSMSEGGNGRDWYSASERE